MKEINEKKTFWKPQKWASSNEEYDYPSTPVLEGESFYFIGNIIY